MVTGPDTRECWDFDLWSTGPGKSSCTVETTMTGSIIYSDPGIACSICSAFSPFTSSSRSHCFLAERVQQVDQHMGRSQTFTKCSPRQPLFRRPGEAIRPSHRVLVARCHHPKDAGLSALSCCRRGSVRQPSLKGEANHQDSSLFMAASAGVSPRPGLILLSGGCRTNTSS